MNTPEATARLTEVWLRLPTPSEQRRAFPQPDARLSNSFWMGSSSHHKTMRASEIVGTGMVDAKLLIFLEGFTPAVDVLESVGVGGGEFGGAARAES